MIKALRAVHELTQGQLAELLGTRQQTISEWELGRYPPGKAYQKLLFYVEKELREKRGLPIKIQE